MCYKFCIEKLLVDKMYLYPLPGRVERPPNAQCNNFAKEMVLVLNGSADFF